MPLTRRTAVSFAGSAIAVGALSYFGWRTFLAPAPGLSSQIRTPADPPPAPTAATEATAGHKGTRSLGDPQAKVTVAEYFSLTCVHCAAFARETMPQVEKDLIAPGKVRFVYHDFPLDQVALTAAMVARYLPAAQYYPFISALFASQDRWAFARDVNTTEEIWKLAALAGMSRETFEQAISDDDLRNWILQQQKEDQTNWNIDSTPSFVIDGKKYSGEMSYEAFRKILPQV
jgi:protein-disulfide isomerase